MVIVFSLTYRTACWETFCRSVCRVAVIFTVTFSSSSYLSISFFLWCPSLRNFDGVKEKVFVLSSCVVLFLCMLEVNEVKVWTNRSSSLPQKTLLLKRLVSGPAFNSVTLWHHITSPCHKFAHHCRILIQGLHPSKAKILCAPEKEERKRENGDIT